VIQHSSGTVSVSSVLTTRRASSRRAFAGVALTAALAACTAAPNSAYTRMIAAHNALTTQGLSQVGAISTATIGEGQSFRAPSDLEAGCYTFMAFGSEGVRDVELTVVNAQGQTVAQENAHEAQAGVRFCPSARGRFQVTARAAQGGGLVTLSTWRGGSATESRPIGGGGGGVVSGGPGSCGEPLPLELGQTVSGTTEQGGSHLTASCARGDAPEIVYRLPVPRRMQVTLASEQEFDGAIYILRQCTASGGTSGGRRRMPNGGGGNEIACNDDDQNARRSRIVQVLDPGEYYVVVDGYSSDSGPFTLAASGQDIPSTDELCQQATTLTLGQPVQGDTSREVDGFQASCANRTPGPDRVFRFDLAQESRVQATLETPNFDGALFIRRACAQSNSEIACNDDAESTRQARVNTVLPAGPYFVYADGFQSGASGPFTLQVDSAPVAGAGLQGDACTDAQPINIGASPTSTQGNLLAARDDIQVSCGGGSDTPDVVYRVDVRSRGRLKLFFEYMDESLREAGGLAIAVQRACGGTAANNTVACRAVAAGEDNVVDAVVTPGTYFVVVDAARARAFGRFTLNASLEDVAPMETACRRATALTPGRTVTGTTSGSDVFHATCAGNARSPENLYRLVIRRRSHVRVEVTSTNGNYDPAIYMRANCADPATERACVDDTNGTTNAVIEDDFDAGTYTIFVDGFSQNNSGPYTLRADVSNPGSGSATGSGGTTRPQPLPSRPRPTP